MDTADSKAQLAEVPHEDGSIVRAIAALDEMINRWAIALADAHGVLQRTAVRTATRDGEDRGPVPADAQVTPTESPRTMRPSIEPALTEQAPVESQGTAAAGPPRTQAARGRKERVESRSPVTKARAGAGKEQDQATIRPKHRGVIGTILRRCLRTESAETAADVSSADARAAEPPPAPNERRDVAVDSDDDEPLLASIDPKKANAVRIKRRLARGKKKFEN